MSDWTQSAGSAYLTAATVLNESGGVLRAKIVSVGYDTFEGKQKPILEVEQKGGVRSKIALNATNMGVLSKWLAGRAESALVGRQIEIGVAMDVRNPRTNTVGPAIRLRGVK